MLARRLATNSSGAIERTRCNAAAPIQLDDRFKGDTRSQVRSTRSTSASLPDLRPGDHSRNLTIDRRHTGTYREAARTRLRNLLAGAADTDRARLYEAIGICATYDPGARIATLELAIPRSAKNVSEGGLEPPRPCGH